MNKAQQASIELRAMDELAAQDSPMHRLSPLSKLFVTVLYIVVTVSFHKYDISGVFVMVLFPLAGYQVGMIPVHTCFHKLRVVMPLVCAVGLFNPHIPVYLRAARRGGHHDGCLPSACAGAEGRAYLGLGIVSGPVAAAQHGPRDRAL